MLTVEKIGGTSMSALDKVLENIIFYGSSKDPLHNRVFVVSAFSGVTDLLLENKKTGNPGVYHRILHHKDFHSSLEQVTIVLKQINKRYENLGLDLALADSHIDGHMRKAQLYLENLTGILSSGYVDQIDILRVAREILASIGESHAAYILASILIKRGVNTQLIDLGGFDCHKALTIDQRIRRAFKHIDLSQSLCIVTGYVKGTEGIMREFDRGYSEVTFSKIAQLLKPREAIIHKEYHLSTADPNIVGAANCSPVGETNYDIADQLADVGMEAIHPRAAKPLEMKGINLRIKNTFEPSHRGTLITSDYISPYKHVEIITGTDKVVMIDVYDPKMVGQVGFDLKIMQILQEYGVSYTFKTTSANSISLVVWERDLQKKMLRQLEENFARVICEDVAVVSLLGTNMDQIGLMAKSAAALSSARIAIKSAGLALGKVNIQFIIAREDFRNAIISLNKEITSLSESNS